MGSLIHNIVPSLYQRQIDTDVVVGGNYYRSPSVSQCHHLRHSVLVLLVKHRRGVRGPGVDPSELPTLDLSGRGQE